MSLNEQIKKLMLLEIEKYGEDTVNKATKGLPKPIKKTLNKELGEILLGMALNLREAIERGSAGEKASN